MVRQQRGLNILPQPLQPSFLLPVYFYIMALFQKEKHLLHWDAQGCLTTCSHHFFFNLSASPISWGVGLPDSWVLALGPFSCRDYLTLCWKHREDVCAQQSMPRSLRNRIGQKDREVSHRPWQLTALRRWGSETQEFHFALPLILQGSSRSLETRSIYFYRAGFKVVKAERSLPTAFNRLWYEFKWKKKHSWLKIMKLWIYKLLKHWELCSPPVSLQTLITKARHM